MQFREAFSCFVFSEAEPKGIDCVEKFKAMQECFREHPDVYGDGECLFHRLGHSWCDRTRVLNLPGRLLHRNHERR